MSAVGRGASALVVADAPAEVNDQNSTTAPDDRNQGSEYAQLQNQTPLRTTELIDNFPAGDIMECPKPKGTTRLYFQNVNGVKSAQDCQDFRMKNHLLRQHEVDCFGFIEPNLAANALTTTAKCSITCV